MSNPVFTYPNHTLTLTLRPGYENLLDSTALQSDEVVGVIVDRFSSSSQPLSIGQQLAKMLNVVANIRASYAALRKDGNARLILRIEKAL